MKYTFFWGGPFSQWETTPFIVDGAEYNSCEQFMMAHKALLFGDEYAHKQIMESKSPMKQKALGRAVKGFDKNRWEAVCKTIVYRCNHAKFTQNQELYDYMMSTVGTEIVEASPEDKIWGIGLHESDPRVHDKAQWQGTNWLGEVLMMVRLDLMQEAKAWKSLLSSI